MHEATITNALVKTLLAEAARHDVSNVKRVTVKIGMLKAVEPQALNFCFNMFTEGTIAENAELVIEHLPPIARCRKCQVQFKVPKFKFRCPDCDDTNLKIIQGEELFIESFEIE